MKNILLIFFLTPFFLILSLYNIANAQTTNIKQEQENPQSESQRTFLGSNNHQLSNKKAQVLPGGVLYIRSPKLDTSSYMAKLGQTKTILISKGLFDDIYTGIDINTVPGEYLLAIETKKKQIKTYSFTVPTPKEINFLDIDSDTMKVVPLHNKKQILNTLVWSNIEPKLPLSLPINDKWTDTFNYLFEEKAKRKTSQENNKLISVDHISLTLNKPSQVIAPTDAVCFSISFSEDHGYTVILDHGMGLFSEISGLYNLTISEQDRVKKGTLIANFNTNDFRNDNKSKSDDKVQTRTVRWRVFLNKSVINPYHLINLK